MNKICKGIMVLLLVPSLNLMAQQNPTPAPQTKVAPDNWHLLDRAQTGYYGISLDKAYDVLKGKKSQTVVVAVIDSGIDTLQEDLKPVLWRNRGEIPNNKIDDEHDGYVDDYFGWNFLGNPDGKNVKQDSYEAARVYWSYKEKHGDTDPDTTKLTGLARWEASEYLRAKAEVTGGMNPGELMMYKRILGMLEAGDSIIAKDLGKTEYNGNDLKNYQPKGQEALAAWNIFRNIQKLNNSDDITNKQIIDDLKGEIRKGEAGSTPPEDFRGEIVKDNYNDINDRYYGNSDVMTGTPTHGTHCAGIIGAVRNNGIGMNGIADNVRIMMVRAVPDGDEHDKDIANAIRFAVDHGAKIISMSFGKAYSPQKNWVDDAVKYAAEHDVLLVHAAGNEGKNLDSTLSFPSPVYLDGSGYAKNYITVGASGDPTNGGIAASFSNYGKHTVDVFAPGVNIYSTLPGGNVYGKMSGTSMAAPVVAGLGALLLEYFPTLSAEQLKYVIEKSVEPINEQVTEPGTDQLVNFSELSVTGGEVNAYNAVKLAEKIKGTRKEKERK